MHRFKQLQLNIYTQYDLQTLGIQELPDYLQTGYYL